LVAIEFFIWQKNTPSVYKHPFALTKGVFVSAYKKGHSILEE